MEKRAARLAPVVDMASKAERDAATQLGKCQQQLLAAQQKLAELERYRNDYQQQWISQGQKGVSGQWLMNYQRFLSRPWLGIDLNLSYSGTSLTGSDCSAYSGHNSYCDTTFMLKASRPFF